jgi:hypothetical protein
MSIFPRLDFAASCACYRRVSYAGGQYGVLIGRSVLEHFVTIFDGPKDKFSIHRPAPEISKPD